MTKPMLHALDPKRLKVLYDTELLDSAADGRFDRLTRLATHALGIPVALVSLVDKDRLFFKSYAGLPEPWATECAPPFSHSYCRQVVNERKPLIINNAMDDDELRIDPLTTQVGIVAYLGMPLITADGFTLGTFCVIDTKPHNWSQRDINITKDLADITVAEIEMRVRLKTATRAVQILTDRNERVISLMENVLDDSLR